VIQTNLPERTVTVKDVKGIVGQKVKVTTPDKDGYTKNNDFVYAQVTKDGIIVNDAYGEGMVTYTKIKPIKPVASNKPSKPGKPSTVKPDVKSDKPEKPTETVTINKVNHIVATHANKGMVKLYDINLRVSSNRALAADSAWFSDQEMTKNGTKYYRVATNEWVKASDIYTYVANKVVVLTNKGSYKELVNSEGNKITNRALASQTPWSSDRKANINGKDYYRVATNEFIAANDITIR
jgi:hypothetical protein